MFLSLWRECYPNWLIEISISVSHEYHLLRKRVLHLFFNTAKNNQLNTDWQLHQDILLENFIYYVVDLNVLVTLDIFKGKQVDGVGFLPKLMNNKITTNLIPIKSQDY